MRKFLKVLPFKKVFVFLFVFLYTLLPSLQAFGVVLEDYALEDVSTEVDVSEDILDEGISTSIYEEEEVVEPLFVYKDGIYTVNTVVEGEEYVYPDDGDVRVRFTSVTQEGDLVISKVKLTEEEKEELNTSDDYGWDISSSMGNGTFTYDLTLPNTQDNDDVEVKYTENGNTYESIENVEVNEGVIYIEGLEHFTVFVVSGVDDTGSCTGASITNSSETTACYTTIQKAIDMASDEDTIYVSPGTYNENLVIQNKNLTLKGPYAGTPADDSLRGNDEAIINAGGVGIAVEISGTAAVTVEIDGFTIADDSNWSSAGIAHKSASPQVTSHILNNIVEAPTSVTAHGNSIQIAGDGSTAIGNKVWVTTLTDPNYSATGILSTDASNTLIENNTVIGNGASNSDNGIVVINYTSTPIGNNKIYDNKIENCDRPISIQAYVGDIQNVDIQGNTIENSPVGLTFTDFDEGHTATYSVIKNNVFTNNEIQVNANNITGIDLDYILANNVFDKAVIRRNSTPLTYVGNKIYSSIQEAIDDADNGDTINVLTGEYNEKISIDKELVLQDLGDSVINGGIELTTNNITIDGFEIKNGEILSGSQKAGIYVWGGTSSQKIINNTLVGQGSTVSGWPGIVLGYNTSNVSIESNTINNWYQGLYINPSSNLEISENTFNNNFVGIGSDGLNNVNILNNTFTDNTFEAIGSSNVGANVKINKNSFDGNTSGINWYSGKVIDGKENWWGDITGPSGASFGKGDSVSENVDFCPWLKSENGNPTETCDVSSPIVNINSPLDVEFVNGNLEVEVEASDNWGMGSYYIRLWQNAAYESNGGILVDQCYSAPGGTNLGTSRVDTCTFDTTELNDGETYYITAQYQNTLKKWGSDVISINIDNSYPTILDSKMYVKKDGVWEESLLTKSGDEVKITIEVKDELTEVDKVQLWIRENPWKPNYNELMSGTMTKVDDIHFEFIYTVPDTYKNGNTINENFEGNYFNFRPWDSVGNSHIGWSTKFTIDNTGAESPVLTGSPVQYVQWGNVTRSWLPSESSDVDYYMYKNISTGWLSGPYDAGKSEYSITHPTGNYDRIFKWQVLAVDYAGNETWSEQTYRVVVDGTKPTVEITNVEITNKKLSFTVAGTDNLSGARTVATNIYNENNSSMAIEYGRLAHNIDPETLTISYDATDIDVSGLTSGTYTIRAAIRDYSENLEYATYKIEVDNTPPSVPTATLTADDISVPTNGYTNSETFTFNLSSTDPVRYQLKYWNDIVGSPFKENTPWHPTDLGGYSSALGVYNDKFTQGEGKHYFAFSACDTADNCSDFSTPFVVTYDYTDPISTITSPSSNYITRDEPEIIGYTEDTYSVDKVVLSYTGYDIDTQQCGTEWTELTTIINEDKELLPFNWSYDQWDLEDGAYCIKAQATDLAGNEENTAIVENVIYDTTAPQVTLGDLVNGVLSGIEAEDSLSGVAKIEVSTDEINWEEYTQEMDLNDLVGNEPGTYTIYIKVTDNAKNSIVVPVTFTIPQPTVLGATMARIKPQPVQASYGIGGYTLAQTNEQDTEEEEITEEEIPTQDSPEVKGEEDNEELNGEEETTQEETTKWWIYPLVILPVLAIFLILWKRRKEDNEPQF